MFTIALKPCIGQFGWHDPSAAIFEDGELLYGVEEERFSRRKHAPNTFPTESIEFCLNEVGIDMSDVEALLIPYRPQLKTKIALRLVSQSFSRDGVLRTVQHLEDQVKDLISARFFPTNDLERRLEEEFGDPLPRIELHEHHACHAASAFHPTDFDDALVLTLDAQGEYDSTVVWHGTRDGVERVRTYKHPNSLGYFFGAVTEFLGYHANNGEGKVMGLAPYGEPNEEVRQTLLGRIDADVDYDVTDIIEGNVQRDVETLESLFGRDRRQEPGTYTQWEKDLAFESQRILEDIVTDIVQHYCSEFDTDNVGLSGGVALNCKMNKRVMELEGVDNVFIQPVAHDAGLAVGAGMLGHDPSEVSTMRTVYWGPEHDDEAIESVLEKNKISYREPDDVEREVAGRLAEGDLVGWFQGRLEMGPRALGNRSILADPRTVESRDRVNKFVKHREEWRPFAPSLLEEAADEYLENPTSAPYMIRTFDVRADRRDEVEAVLHPADDTTRPQTVNEEQNPRYHRLISEFEAITGVPVVLNTSFNDNGEPIVNKPMEALKDFYGMGLDVLVMEDFLVEKPESPPE